jgi:hypothetical protein
MLASAEDELMKKCDATSLPNNKSTRETGDSDANNSN